jgi:predicted chitinase
MTVLNIMNAIAYYEGLQQQKDFWDKLWDLAGSKQPDLILIWRNQEKSDRPFVILNAVDFAKKNFDSLSNNQKDFFSKLWAIATPQQEELTAIWRTPLVKVNRAGFFREVRDTFGALSQAQVDGFNGILNYWDNSNYDDPRWLAYILATVWHETGGLMQPIREGFAQTNQGAIAAVTDIYNRGIISTNYALPYPNGNSYYGRGLVQITWPDNYLQLGRAIGIGNELYNNPDLALKEDIALKILFIGMVDGLFTGQKLADYFNDAFTDWTGAREIINGTDKAKIIGGYAQDFLQAIA